VALFLHNWEFPGSDLNLETIYPDRFFVEIITLSRHMSE
jgi:hypothetical protein